MPGEIILVVEDNSAERDFAQASLEDAGYKVIPAANAAAALTMPDVGKASVIVMDAHLEGVDGFETTKRLRQQNETQPTPILLLMPEEEIDQKQDLSPRGANGYLLKPYDSKSLAKKVRRLIDEQHLEELARQFLNNAADAYMKEVADKHVKGAVDRKTQIIIERCIQNVASAVDTRARAYVNESVTALTAEKEQELVKITVREVAQSMVEKLAERKVTEAMETVLAEQAERSVKKIIDQILPGSIRDRLKDTLNNTLPREIQSRVQKAIDKQGPEIGRQLFATVEETVKKVVPRVTGEVAPDILERQFRTISSDQVPRLVKDLVAKELDLQVSQKLEPAIAASVDRLRATVWRWTLSMGVVMIIGFAALFAGLIFTKRRDARPAPASAPAAAAPAQPSGAPGGEAAGEPAGAQPASGSAKQPVSKGGSRPANR